MLRLPAHLLLTLLTVSSCNARELPVRARDKLPPPTYPTTPMSEHVDDYFGTRVADPYRWLEELESPQVREWIERQNQVSRPYLERLPLRAAIRERLTELWSYRRYAIPVVAGGRYFYERNDGLQAQNVLYVTESLETDGRVLIDPNGFSDDGTTSLAAFVPSPDGAHVAYSVSEGGSDWDSWRVRAVETGEDLEDHLRFTKFTGVSWTRDGRAFYYSRYPQGPDGSGDDTRQVRVYRHRLGTPQTDDELVFEITDHPTRNPYAQVTHDGRYLVLDVFDGYEANGVYYRQLDRAARDGEIVRLLDDWDALYEFLGNDGDTFYFYTNHEAPTGRIVAIDVARPEPQHWREVVAPAGHAIETANLVGKRLIVVYLEDAKSLVRAYGLEGELQHTLALPGIGSVDGFAGEPDQEETFYAYTSFVSPPTIHRYDVATGASTLWRRPDVDLDPSGYETRQVFYQSADGTRVPMFVTHRKGRSRDAGGAPTLLYGYGGFNVSLTPGFDRARLVWLEMGGLLAVPNLRGGGEYGEAWHLAGTKERKQNVFDDFLAAAEWLVANGYTAPARLGIQGRSNGGLLVGAAIIQRPELFGAALPAVGVLDMLRYHTASANARQWSSDYGTSEVEEEFRALYSYSPVHNVEPGTCYPPTLISTADRDDRVVPWHSYKFAAALQAAQGCDHPILLSVETRAGHGAGKPTWMRIEEAADELAFLAEHLGVDRRPGVDEAPSRARISEGEAPRPRRSTHTTHGKEKR